jgi:hypothetical protein
MYIDINISGLVIANYRSAIHISLWKKKTILLQFLIIKPITKTNEWVLSHTCVRKNSKGPPMKSFCPFYWLGAGGGGDAPSKWGRVRGPQPAFFTRVLGKRRAIRRGGGGTGRHTLTPSPQAAITIENAHHARSCKHNIFLKVQYWPRIPSHASPPTRARRPPPMFFCSMTSEYLYEVHYEVRCWPGTKNFSV